MIPDVKLPWTSLGKYMESLCRKAILRYKMLENVNGLAVALSGGKDSLTLLYLLRNIIGRGFPDIPIFAFNVTGGFSCGADVGEDLLQKICDSINVKFISINNTMSLNDINCYKCARERRKLMFKTAKSLGIDYIAFGHHSDDNIETFLLNLFTKGRVESMLPKIYFYKYDVTIIRPLIFITEDMIKSFAKMYKFERYTCQCIYGQDSYRKKTKDLITEIKEVFPQVKKNLANACLKKENKRST